MGRLIDSDEIEKKLEEILCEPDYQHAGENWSVGVNLSQSAIYGVSTAYDVEEVLKQIEELKDSFHGGTLQEHYFKIALETAIEIVRNGGVK